MKLLTLPLVCLLFSGCSFLSELFIQNRSKTTDVVVTITYKIPRAEFVRKEAGMSYVPQIVTPKQYRRDKRKAALTITNRSDSTISILVPASSTARITSVSSNKSYGDKIIKISHNGKQHPHQRIACHIKEIPVGLRLYYRIEAPCNFRSSGILPSQHIDQPLVEFFMVGIQRKNIIAFRDR